MLIFLYFGFQVWVVFILLGKAQFPCPDGCLCEDRDLMCRGIDLNQLMFNQRTNFVLMDLRNNFLNEPLQISEHWPPSMLQDVAEIIFSGSEDEGGDLCKSMDDLHKEMPTVKIVINCDPTPSPSPPSPTPSPPTPSPLTPASPTRSPSPPGPPTPKPWPTGHLSPEELEDIITALCSVFGGGPIVVVIMYYIRKWRARRLFYARLASHTNSRTSLVTEEAGGTGGNAGATAENGGNNNLGQIENKDEETVPKTPKTDESDTTGNSCTLQ